MWALIQKYKNFKIDMSKPVSSSFSESFQFFALPARLIKSACPGVLCFVPVLSLFFDVLELSDPMEINTVFFFELVIIVH